MQLPNDQNASGRSFGEEELEILKEVINSGHLNCTGGTVVRAFEEKFAAAVGTAHCRTVTSGTAAVHAAIAAVDPEPGDEVITTPITDMGAITPILYQTAIPVFADVDPTTWNVTAESIEACITPRTRAVIVTHLFGNPCDMDPIIELCRRKELTLVEDAAQAYGATYKGKPVGSLGDIGCFSLQQGKQMTTGEGGMVVTSDPRHERRMRLFIDKAWGYGDPAPDHYFLAPNYRMTELQGAVAMAQLAKLPAMVEQRQAMAARLAAAIEGVAGVEAPRITEGATHTYWKFPLRIDEAVIQGGADAFSARMKEAGVWSAPRYIRKPAFECQVIKERRTFGSSGFPFVGPHMQGREPVVYDRADFPGTEEGLRHVVVLPINEKYREEHVDFVADAIKASAADLRRDI